MDLNPRERRLINAFQKGLPLDPRPFRRMAERLGCSEQVVIDMLHSLERRGILSRVGAVVAPNRVGASTLAALEVPAERLEEVAAKVSAHPEVNHNYEREHGLNLWFVVTAPDAAELDRVLREIEGETGLTPLNLPLEDAYHIDLGFPV